MCFYNIFFINFHFNNVLLRGARVFCAFPPENCYVFSINLRFFDLLNINIF